MRPGSEWAPPSQVSDREPSGRFNLDVIHQAARLYYTEDLTQAEIATRLGVSRPTVSRLISEARRLGLVRIEVINPALKDIGSLQAALENQLGLRSVRISPLSPAHSLKTSLMQTVSSALSDAELRPGEVLLISSGRTMYEVSHAEMPPLSGVTVAPTVGGVAEPQAWYQTNEITRVFAERTFASPAFLFSQALPSTAMHQTLLNDPDFRATTSLWDRARVALVGVGAPTLSRSSLTRSIEAQEALLSQAAGDVCLNFFDYQGRPIEFEDRERIVAISRAQLGRIEHAIAVAIGEEKVVSIIAGARGKLFNELVTDIATAEQINAALTADADRATTHR